MKEQKKIRVAIGMSGGVDSSVSALLLKQKGYDVVGLFMKLWHDPCGVGENKCCDEKSLMDARTVAEKIGIKLYEVDVRKEFKDKITDYFVNEYDNLRTPNPCVLCNKKIKFGWLLDFAEKIGCDYLATGHYARIASNSGREKGKVFGIKAQNTKYSSLIPAESFSLFKAHDLAKDQSYFLYRLNQNQLSKIVFPLGEMTKTEVRKIAKENDLPVSEKKESQEICFVSDDYREFLHRYLPEGSFAAGDIVDAKGNVIGRHNGLPNYTIGQRKGIEQSRKSSVSAGTSPDGKAKSIKKALYVLGFDKEKNKLIVGPDNDLFKSEFEIENVHWIDPETESRIMNSELDEIEVKIRYGASATGCVLKILNTKYSILLNKPIRAITPGQSAVFYIGDEIIGGGTIV